MTSEPKMTVVIPTRERANVLAKTLATITAQDYDNLTIVVSDNDSRDATKDVVLGCNDPRIRYVNPGKRLSMSDNWEFALSHVSEGWLTILGDDDGLVPAALHKAAEIARSTSTTAIRTRVCTYLWPSPGKHPYGSLTVPLTHGQEVRDSRVWLSRVMNGAAPYADLPMLYNGGFIDSSIVRRLRERSGRFYRSLCPDVYSAIAIASIVPTYVFSSDPLAINGVSAYSTGASTFSTSRDHPGSPARVFLTEDNIPIHADISLQGLEIPSSIQVVVYESYLQSQFLREGDHDIKQQQLEIVLATMGEHEESVTRWCRAFCARHSIDFELCQRRAAKRRWKRRLVLGARSRIGDVVAASSHVIGSRSCPVTDVYQASVATAAIRAQLPTLPERLRQLAAHLTRRVRDRA